MSVTLSSEFPARILGLTVTGVSASNLGRHECSGITISFSDGSILEIKAQWDEDGDFPFSFIYKKEQL